MVEPMLQPTAPAIATSQIEKRPVDARYPAKGMITSEGKGMHADSTAISNTMPP